MKILHPTDFSKASKNALGLAQQLRDLTGGSLTILYAAEPRYASAAHYINPETEGIFDEAERAWSVLMTHQLSELDPTAENILEAGKPIPNILKHAADHDLIVMGTHGEDSLVDRLLGTTTERVIAQGHKPVAVVPASAEVKALNHLLVGTAPMKPSEQALELAQQIAGASGGKVTLLHIGESAMLPTLNAQIQDLPLTKQNRLEAKILSSTDSPAAALLDYAAESQADALLIGRGRMSGIFGSVTRSILNQAKIPVFVHP